MQWEVNLSTNSIQSYSDINNLADKEYDFPNYAMCLPRYSKLDGSYVNVNSIDLGNIGYMSLELSDENGNFKTYPTITVEFQRRKTSQGINFVFNKQSGDYCNSLTVAWYKNDKLVLEKDYTPTDTSFTALTEVDAFTKAVITFKSTSKPYRYLWVGLLENERITQSEGLKITYYDTTYGAKQKVTSITGDCQSISDYDSMLKDDTTSYPGYALCLPNYSKLDGEFINMVDNPSEMGFVSTELSDESGNFTSNPTLTINISANIKARGISLYGNDLTGDYCNSVNIKWYRDDTLVADEDFSPNSISYLCSKQVDLFNKVIITFKSTNNPYRFVFLRGFDFGIIRIFTEKEITDCGCYQEIDPISTELSINTMDFSLYNVDNLNLDFQKSQKCKLYFDKNIIGVFYVKKGTRETKDTYSISTEDFVSILDYNYHCGGIYNNKNVVELVNEIFNGENIEVSIDETFNDTTVTGYLPYDTKRNNLAQIALAIGAIIDTSFDDTLYIYPSSKTTSDIKITENQIYSDTLKINHDDVITGVELTVHKYTESSETEELLNDTVTGQILVKFDNPMKNLSISGGTINSYSVNHAYITGSGATVVLTGEKYLHDEQVISMENEYATEDKKIMSVEDATLVNSDNAPTILNRLFEYYNNNQTIDADILLDDLEVSDNVSIDTYDGNKTGIIKSLDMEFSNEIKAKVEIQCKDS